MRRTPCGGKGNWRIGLTQLSPSKVGCKRRDCAGWFAGLANPIPKPVRGDEADLLCVGKFVTDTPDCQNELWVFGIIFDLRAQAIDVRINRAVVAFVRVIPNLLEQILARENATGISRKQTQQIEFFCRYIDMLVGDRHFAPNWIDPEFAAHDGCFVMAIAGGGRSPRTSQNRLDAGLDFAQAEWFGDLIVGAHFEP